MTNNEKIRAHLWQKYNGRCAYCGKPLGDDWQIDHVKPVYRYKGKLCAPEADVLENMVPAISIVNHYKRAASVDVFRTWLLGELHTRMTKLPKNPKSEKSIRHKAYMLRIAELFDITPDKPFSGVFYMETLKR